MPSLSDLELTNTELALLGLLAEQPKHAYQLEQDIAARGMRDWTEIGFSSIYYILNRLETSGQLTSIQVVETGENAPRGRARSLNRRVYHLTSAGWESYRAAVRRRLAQPRLFSADFDLGLANLPALPPPEARAALETHREILQTRLAQVQSKWAADRAAAGPYFPPHVDALFSRSLVMLQADLDWVTHYLAQPEEPYAKA